MKYLLITTALLVAGGSQAQEPLRLAPVNNSPVIVTFQDGRAAPTAIPTAPIPVVVAPECKTTACVTEPKKNTKTVYTSVCKEYCVPQCSLFNWFGSGCGCDNCEKRTKNVLVKKKVPACDTTQCVIKEVHACTNSLPVSK